MVVKISDFRRVEEAAGAACVGSYENTYVAYVAAKLVVEGFTIKGTASERKAASPRHLQTRLRGQIDHCCQLVSKLCGHVSRVDLGGTRILGVERRGKRASQ